MNFSKDVSDKILNRLLENRYGDQNKRFCNIINMIFMGFKKIRQETGQMDSPFMNTPFMEIFDNVKPVLLMIEIECDELLRFMSNTLKVNREDLDLYKDLGEMHKLIENPVYTDPNFVNVPKLDNIESMDSEDSLEDDPTIKKSPFA